MRNPLNNLKKVSGFFLRDLINVLKVFFMNHKSVPLVYWAITQKSNHPLILIDYVCRCFLTDYLAEYAFGHGNHTFQRFVGRI
jgi:hypothetical protein